MTERAARSRTANVARAEPPSSRLGRRVGPQADQLGEPDPAGARALPEPAEVGDRRDAEMQVAGGEGAVGAACEHGRAHVLLPQDLERRALGRESVWIGSGADTNLSGYA